MEAQRTPCETLRRAFRNASNVESQESCIHPMLSHAALARPILRCSPLLSRPNKGNDYRNENGYKATNSAQNLEYGGFHVQSPTNSLHLPMRLPLKGSKSGLQVHTLSVTRAHLLPLSSPSGHLRYAHFDNLNRPPNS